MPNSEEKSPSNELYSPSPNQQNLLETPKEKKERWLSIIIIYFTVFLMSLGFTLVLTAIWPYMQKLDRDSTTIYLGLVVASNPFAQMVFSPLAGWWANKIKSVQVPIIITLVIFVIASIAYSVLEMFPDNTRHWLLVSRFFVGASSANMAICRSYLSSATTIDERTKGVAYISLAQVLGFIAGPALQAAVTPIGGDGWSIETGRGKLTLDMYTACGWLSVLLGIINVILLLPCIFKETTIAAKEAMLMSGAASEKDAWKGVKLDYLSAWTLIMAFFIISFNFTLLETLGTPLTMDQFAWSSEEVVYYMGLLLAVGGVISCITFIFLNPLCRKFGELEVMIWGGFLLMAISGVIMIPWGTDPPVLKDMDAHVNETIIKNGTSALGCPIHQEWCYYTPAMTVRQFLIGFILVAFGYPIGITLIQTVFSKILGPRPQGVWMGLMTGAGCLSRVMGPLCVSVIYSRLGPVWTFGITTVTMIVALITLNILLTRLRTAYNNAVELSLKASAGPEGIELSPLAS